MPVSLGRRFGCFAMLQGLLYAINHGAQVVNISAGMSFTDAMANMSVEQQIEIAHREFRDQEAVWKYVFDMADKFYVTIVWAAGNENVFTALDASKRGDNTKGFCRGQVDEQGYVQQLWQFPGAPDL